MEKKPTTDKENPQGQEKPKNTHVHIEGGVEVDLTENLKEQRHAEHEETTAQNKKQLFWARITAGLVFVYAGLTFWQACSTKKAADATKNAADTAKTASDTAKDALRISQGAYVTIGRKDGVVADFVIPKNSAQNAELVIFFQNGGHTPARFAWSAGVSFLGAGSTKKSGITFTHPFAGMWPLGNRVKTTGKGGGISGPNPNSTIIAADSILVSTLGTISQSDLKELPRNDPSLLILGNYEYCDELGNWSAHSFALRYRANAPSSSLNFDLAMDQSVPTPPLPQTTDKGEMLPPCETTAEHEKNQKEMWKK